MPDPLQRVVLKILVGQRLGGLEVADIAGKGVEPGEGLQQVAAGLVAGDEPRQAAAPGALGDQGIAQPPHLVVPGIVRAQHLHDPHQAVAEPFGNACNARRAALAACEIQRGGKARGRSAQLDRPGKGTMERPAGRDVVGLDVMGHQHQGGVVVGRLVGVVPSPAATEQARLRIELVLQPSVEDRAHAARAFGEDRAAARGLVAEGATA